MSAILAVVLSDPVFGRRSQTMVYDNCNTEVRGVNPPQSQGG